MSHSRTKTTENIKGRGTACCLWNRIITGYLGGRTGIFFIPRYECLGYREKCHLLDPTWGAILHCRKLEGKDDPHLLVVYVQGDMRDVNHLLLHYPTDMEYVGSWIGWCHDRQRYATSVGIQQEDVEESIGNSSFITFVDQMEREKHKRVWKS